MSSSGISSWSRHGFEINTDKSKLDKTSILKMLGATYWARDVSPDNLWTSIQNSRSYGLYSPQGEQADLEAIADQLFDPETQPTAQ